jgi:hypothetical protein
VASRFPVPYSEAQSENEPQRPFLTLHLTGPNGHGEALPGLVDSGADFSCLPTSTARLLGYTRKTLRERDIRQIDGVVEALQATVPITAYVLGLSSMTFELMPLFIRDCQPLWGRSDFFRAFRSVAFDEGTPQLVLTFDAK